MYRKSYALVNKNILEENIREIKKKYPNYEYYMGVVKNNAYHHGIEVIDSLIKGGINYLAVSSLEEALDIRAINKDIPVLILEPIPIIYIDIVLKNNITLTVESLSYTKELVSKENLKKLKVHLKLDTGMNRLGFKRVDELQEAYILLKDKVFIEGIYTHFATSGRGDIFYKKQLDKLKEFLDSIDVLKIPIRHFDRSITMVSHEKIKESNGVRLGIIMYGFSQSVKVNTEGIKNKLRLWKRKMYIKNGFMMEYTTINDLNLKPAYSLYSTILAVRPVSKDEFVGYNASFKVLEDGYIASIAIGYADGVTKDFKKVVIDGKKLDIVSDSMDMIMVFSKNKLEVGSKVEIIGENRTIREVTRDIKINSYHLFNQISKRVPIIYEEDENEK